MMSTIRSSVLLSACLAALCALPVRAQSPAAAPAAAAADVPATSCRNPGAVPVDKAGPEMGRFQKKVDEYKTCTTAYVNNNRVKSTELETQARAYADAANSAIEDYNNYVNGLNDATKSTKSGAAKN